jgi:hypothetical protein
MANKPGEFPIFTPIDRGAISQAALKFSRYLDNLPSVLGIDISEIHISEDVVREIVGRVEKRRVYLHVFHGGSEMGELDEGALLSFWITKLCPFYHPGISSGVLNAKIALCLFINSVYYHSDIVRNEKRISTEFLDHLFYSLRFRDIGKESLMLLAESLVT